MQKYWNILRPNSTALAYALFLATNAASIWGGVFPFLPLEYQTPQLLFWFFFAQATAFSLTFFINGAGAYYLPHLTRRFIAALAAVPYFVGWSCLIASIYLREWALPITVIGGAFLGLGSAGFYLLWQRLFVAQEPDRGTRDLVLGTAYAAVIYLALYLVPRAMTVFLIPLVFMPLFCLAIVLKSRTVDSTQPMFSDEPRQHPLVYRQALRLLWRSTVCMASVGFCTGIMRALAIEAPLVGAYVNVLSMATLLVVAVTLLLLWRVKNLMFDVTGMYRIAFPIVLTAVILLPFMPVAYVQWLAAGLYAIYSIALMLLMLQAGQVSRDRGVSPLFLYGFMGGSVFLMHDGGFIVGSLVDFLDFGPAFSLSTIALVTSYLLTIMYFISRNRLHEPALGAFDDSIELMQLPDDAKEAEPLEAEAPADKYAADNVIGDEYVPPLHPDPTVNNVPPASSPALATSPHAALVVDPLPDLIPQQIERLRDRYGLSQREAEVAEQVVRGKTVARIADDLFVSENTVRTHMKRIYAKLNIHKKMELIDLVESM